MAAPTVDSLRIATNVDFASLGYDEDAKLGRLLNVAVRTVHIYTDQAWAAETPYTFVPVAPLTGADEVMVEEAVYTFTEWLAHHKQADVIETMGDFELISSFSAGSYSETRRSGKDSQEASRALLRNLLWPIMSADKQDEWLALEAGVVVPSFAVTEVDWQGLGVGVSEGLVGANSYPYPIYEPWPGGRGFWE
jgi:hypothetical protein